MNFGVRKLESSGYMWRYLRDSMFSRFDAIPECDRHSSIVSKQLNIGSQK